MSRIQLMLIELAPGERFYLGQTTRIPYRKLPDQHVIESDHGHTYPAVIYSWAREDWTEFQSHHSWNGAAPDVWVKE